MGPQRDPEKEPLAGHFFEAPIGAPPIPEQRACKHSLRSRSTLRPTPSQLQIVAARPSGYTEECQPHVPCKRHGVPHHDNTISGRVASIFEVSFPDIWNVSAAGLYETVIQGQRLLHTVQANFQSADQWIRIKQKQRRLILNTVTCSAETDAFRTALDTFLRNQRQGKAAYRAYRQLAQTRPDSARQMTYRGQTYSIVYAARAHVSAEQTRAAADPRNPTRGAGATRGTCPVGNESRKSTARNERSAAHARRHFQK